MLSLTMFGHGHRRHDRGPHIPSGAGRAGAIMALRKMAGLSHRMLSMDAISSGARCLICQGPQHLPCATVTIRPYVWRGPESHRFRAGM